MIKAMRSLWFILASVLLAGTSMAAGEGQEDLDKATEAKLTAESLADLGEVIRLAESALQKGLDETNTEFAKKLLAATYLQRAQETVAHLFVNLASIDDLRQRRQFALGDVEKALKYDPKQPQAYLLMAQLQMLPGGEGEKAAREALNKALELNIDDPLVRARAYMLRAGLQEDEAKKLADFDEALRLAPNEPEIVRARGLALGDMGKLEAAVTDLKKAIELEPDDGPTYEALALVLTQLKRYDEALAALEKARQLSPEAVAPLMQRARIHAAQEKLDAALADLSEAEKLAPENAAVILLRGALYQDKGEMQKALAEVERALALQPELPPALRMHAALLVEEKRFDEALADLEKLLRAEPDDKLTLLQIGMVYAAQKKSAKAIEIYTKILEDEPEMFLALRSRGDAYLNIGRHAQAIADYEKALKLQPEDPGLLNNFAWVLATSPDDKLRDGKRALELATKACELTEYKPAFMLSTLAAAYAEQGDFQSAIKWSSKAVEIGDEEHDASLKKELESYKAQKPWRELLSEEPATDTPAPENKTP